MDIEKNNKEGLDLIGHFQGTIRDNVEPHVEESAKKKLVIGMKSYFKKVLFLVTFASLSHAQ